MNELKLLRQDDTIAVIGGYGVIFGGSDLEGERFTADTDYMLDLVPVKPVYIDHSEATVVEVDGKRYKLAGIDRSVGHVISVTPDDVGLYMELQFEKADQYWPIVEAMVNTGRAGLSSGTVGHLARRDGKTITRWPIIEESITLTPAEPRTVGVERLKTLAADNPALEVYIAEAAGTPADDSTAGSGAASKSTITIMESDMAEENVTPTQPDIAAIDERIDGLSESVNKILKALESAPAAEAAGYVTNMGGAADPGHKSFGDWLLAVQRKDIKRLGEVYRSQKDLAEGAGATGGYLVPTEFHNELLRVAAEQSPIYSRVRKQPVSTDAGVYPALDQFVAPTAGSGQTAFAAGVKATKKGEGVQLDETQPAFTNLEYRINKVGGFVEVTNELVADSPQSIDALLRSLFGITIAAKNERNILFGDGVGEPLGIMNADCTIGVPTKTNDTFAYEDALAMFARFRNISNGQPVWIAHTSLMPQIGVLAVAANSPVVWAANLAQGQPATLLGYPIIFSEHMNQSKTNDMILADLGSYVMFERQALSIAFSEHAAFKSDMGTWRFTARNDGKPWLKKAITLAGPGATYTVSPFVYHND